MEKERDEWSIVGIWNDNIRSKQKEVQKREHVYASEIGKNYYERYLKMNGVQPDIPFPDRVLRKFTAGIWFEDMIGYILKTVGILQSAQEYVEIPETKDTLRVTGKMDFLAGGLTNWDEARERVKKAEFTEAIEDVCLRMIDHFEEQYPKGLDDRIVEVKSVNSQVFWAKKDYLQEAYPHHIMQLYTYVRQKNKKGSILYISKDDLTVAEFMVMPDSEALEEKWQKDVQDMTYYIRNGIEPPKPDFVVFDKRKKLRFQHEKEKQVIQGCWTENWEVIWSPYFHTITGCKTEGEWEDIVKPKIRELNEQLKAEYKAKLEDKK